MEEIKFYDIHEQTKYKITVSLPNKPEDLSDFFTTSDELKLSIGNFPYVSNSGKTELFFRPTIKMAIKEWGDKLVKSGKRTLIIDDEELLDILKDNHISDFTDADYARRGNRICYKSNYKRKKTKPTQGDIRQLWHALMYGFRRKHGCYPSHIPMYDRHITMFKAFKQIVGWRRVRMSLSEGDQVRFIRQIWDNPEEYIK